jgi:carbonic anhydrase
MNIDKAMKLMRRLALSLFVHVPVLKCLLSGNDSVAVGAEHSFSYDPNSALGPSNWGDIDYNNNQCAGDRNSPIALKSSHCSTNGDYKSTVRCVRQLMLSLPTGGGD